jgi:hypothetical protein
MSQSDYLKRKRMSTVLRNDTNSYITNSQSLVDYNQYHTENNIVNENQLYNKVVTGQTRLIFDIEQSVTNCPICVRTNRELNNGSISILPLNWSEIKTNSEIYQHKLTSCKCNHMNVSYLQNKHSIE